LSADRTVSYGDMLAVVIEYDGSGRLSSDSVAISGLSAQGSVTHSNFCAMVLKTASWAAQAIIPNVILGFSDGTFGTLYGAFPCSATSTLSYDSGTTPDEYALRMTFDGPVAIDGGGGFWQHESGADAEFVVYNGNSAMTDGTRTLDSNMIQAAAGNRFGFVPSGAYLSLSADTNYHLSLKPTTTNNVLLHYFDVAAAGHLQAHAGGEGWVLCEQTNGGGYSITAATRRPFLWPMLAGIDDGAGGGGGTAIIRRGGLSARL